MTVELGRYFIVTSGYCESSGLVNKSEEALLFLAEGGNLYRPASQSEIREYSELHPILKGVGETV
ncbi:hypothetical protein N9D02_10785 [Emcibacteraceae bacterium]|uniref:hypothetical protein n=1 Tax=Pseudemcibacter sp. TaxID=2943293 RepID=UPI002327094C|nr:hypothetical protein [Emcibacteraceae bacterium]